MNTIVRNEPDKAHPIYIAEIAKMVADLYSATDKEYYLYTFGEDRKSTPCFCNLYYLHFK